MEKGPGSLDTIEFNPKPWQIFYNRNPQILLWLFLIITLSSVSFAFIAPLIYKLSARIKALPQKHLAVSIILGVFLFTSLLFVLDQGNSYTYTAKGIMSDMKILFKYPTQTFLILLLPVFIVGSLCISGILLTAYSTSNLIPSHTNKEQLVDTFRQLRNDMNQFLLILGLLAASGSVITTSALRNSINHFLIGSSPFELIPVEIVYVYSLLFTLFIVVAYIPAYYTMTNTGKKIAETLNPFSLSALPDWNTKKIILEEHLGLKATLKENLSSALIVISPLVSALISQLIGK